MWRGAHNDELRDYLMMTKHVIFRVLLFLERFDQAFKALNESLLISKSPVELF